MEDYEVLRKVWEGGIPIEFRIDKEDLVSKTEVSYFEVLPRISYFYLELDRALKFFNSNNSFGDFSNLWLESNGKVLKHYPIGVLFDLHSNSEYLPWTITIHLKNFPDTLIRCSNGNEKRYCFLQAIKEADQLKNRGNVVQEMKPEEHNRLFDSLFNRNFDEFRSTNTKLRAVANAHYLPIRFHRINHKTFQQVLIKPAASADSSDICIGDAVRMAFPDETFEKADFVTHGISIPPETHLNWLCRNLSYADNFVHLVIKDN